MHFLEIFVNTCLTKVFMAIFAPDERLPPWSAISFCYRFFQENLQHILACQMTDDIICVELLGSERLQNQTCAPSRQTKRCALTHKHRWPPGPRPPCGQFPNLPDLTSIIKNTSGIPRHLCLKLEVLVQLS